MTSMPDKIVLHLGAHKTASTHLQQSIAAAGDLPGVAFWGPPELRLPGASIAARFALAEGASEAKTRAMLLAMAKGQPRLVLSDENFAGGLQTGWGRIPMPPYPKAQNRLAALAAMIARAGGPQIDVCLGIRDPAQFLTSAYSQILHGKRVVFPQKYLDKNPLNGVDWADYVARLRAVQGVGSLTVWRHEDYGAAFSQICRILVGDPNVAAAPGRSQRRLSQRALDAVLLAKEIDMPNMVAEAAQEYPLSDVDRPFTLYSSDEMTLSQDLYAAQCKAIATMPQVTFLHA